MPPVIIVKITAKTILGVTAPPPGMPMWFGSRVNRGMMIFAGQILQKAKTKSLGSKPKEYNIGIMVR
jgi:hypothetical protein